MMLKLECTNVISFRWVHCVEKLSNEEFIAASLDGILNIYNGVTGERIITINSNRQGGRINCMLVLSPEKVVTGSKNGKLLVWNLNPSRQIKQIFIPIFIFKMKIYNNLLWRMIVDI